MNISTNSFLKSQNSIHHNKAVANAFATLFETQGFQFHVTANFNRVTSINNGRDKLRLWSSRVDRELFGSRYYKKRIDERMFFAAVPEFGNSSLNLHYHMLVRVPEHRHTNFQCVGEAIWKTFNPTGSLFIQRIGNLESDKVRVIGYDLKEAWKKNRLENIIFSSEFSAIDCSLEDYF